MSESSKWYSPTNEIVFGLAGGGTDIAPYNDLSDKVPDDVKEQINEARQAIIDGTLVVPFNETPFE